MYKIKYDKAKFSFIMMLKNQTKIFNTNEISQSVKLFMLNDVQFTSYLCIMITQTLILCFFFRVNSSVSTSDLREKLLVLILKPVSIIKDTY